MLRLYCKEANILQMEEKVVKKLVVVGDGACGKTSLLTVFVTNEFPESHVPTVFDAYIKEVVVEDQIMSLALWDTAGEEDYDRLRPLSYSRTDVVLICFSIDNPTSLQNVKLKWYPEIKHFLPTVFYFLVGTKLDLRTGKSKKGEMVTYEDGVKMSRRIRADGYLECSAKYSLGVRHVFEESARISLSAKKKSFFRDCFIL